MINFMLELLNVVFSSFSTYFIMLLPMWKSRDRSSHFVYIYAACHMLLICVTLLLIRQLANTEIESFNTYKFAIGVPMVPLAFLTYRKNAWQNVFALAISFVYNLIPQGAGNYVLDNQSPAVVYPMLFPTALTIAVTAVTLPPLLIILRSLYNNPSTKQAVKFWRLIWTMPMMFFVVFLMGNNYLFTNDINAVYFFTFRIVMYGVLTLLCFLFDAVLRHMYEAEMARVEAEETRLKERELALEKTALERVNSLKTELTRTVSHEMRTPLAVMMGFAELTAENARRKGIEGVTAEHMDTIAAEARRMTIMLEELSAPLLIKEFSKDRWEISPNGVIQQITGLYEMILERKKVRLIVDLPQDLPAVYVNEHELTQVMFNLIRNADRHTDSGAVNVSATAADNEVTFTVTDTGAGIDPELLPRVFDRGMSGEQGGMGFGLAICKDIIEAHGGKIWLESEQGKGTTASFTLPVYNRAE